MVLLLAVAAASNVSYSCFKNNNYVRFTHIFPSWSADVYYSPTFTTTS